jgi:hypothetical protein
MKKNKAVKNVVTVVEEQTYRVEVCRTYYGYETLEVEASSEEEAEKKALEECGDFNVNSFSDNDEIVSCDLITDECDEDEEE